MRFALACSTLVALGATRGAHADEPDPTDRARTEFVAGVELAGKGLWGEALAAFERSAKLRPHALTTYDIATCERALGAYTRARATYARALDEDARAGGAELPTSYADEAKTRKAEIEALLAHVEVTLEPADAAISLDGRPLAPDAPESATLVAGVAPAGRPRVYRPLTSSCWRTLAST